MTNSEYEKILKKSEKTDWYGVEVPKDLINGSVLMWSHELKSEIDKIESELSELRGTDLDKRKGYLNALYNNLKNAPYTINGDFYLIKKKRIEAEIEEENKKAVKKTKPKTTTTKKKTSNTTTKNSDLIFGKK